MQNTYVIRLKHGYFLCFYYMDGEILYRTINDNKWAEAELLVQNARPNYSVSLNGEGKLYVFCQKNSGDVILFLNDGSNWIEKTILQNKSSKINQTTVYPIFEKGTLKAVYICNEQSYISTFSNDRFNAPVKFNANSYKGLTKATYLDALGEQLCREIYLEQSETFDICSVKEEKREPESGDLNTDESIVQKLKRELEGKEREIISLHSMLAMKDEEISQANFLRKESQRILQRKVEELEREAELDWED